MNGDVLEELVLSGALFNGRGGDDSPRRGGSPSSSRSASPDPFPVPAQYDSDGEGQGTSYIGNRQSSSATAAAAVAASDAQHEPIGLGPGRTGVKGVIRDRDEARSRDLERIQKEMEDLAVRQQKMDFSVPSYLEELDSTAASSSKGAEDQKREGDAWGGVEEWRRRRMEELKAGGRTGGGGTNGGGGVLYGHLREVGVGGFVEAVEKVPKEVWVVVHIYDGSLGRCAILDSHLSSLARLYPSVKFLRARAGAIGFATNNGSSNLPSSTSSFSHRSSTFRRNPGPSKKNSGGGKRYRDPDESDSEDDTGAAAGFVGAYPADGDEDDDQFEDEDEGELEPDYDVLPTMLVYRGGELAFSWPRVDFDIASVAGKGGGVGYGGANAIEMRDVEALLVKHNIIHPSSSTARAGGRHMSDDEDAGELEFASDVE